VTAARQQVTREWWEESLNQFDTYISALVLEEASGGGYRSSEPIEGYRRNASAGNNG